MSLSEITNQFLDRNPPRTRRFANNGMRPKQQPEREIVFGCQTMCVNCCGRMTRAGKTAKGLQRWRCDFCGITCSDRTRRKPKVS